jgi:hypothetical protein
MAVSVLSGDVVDAVSSTNPRGSSSADNKDKNPSGSGLHAVSFETIHDDRFLHTECRCAHCAAVIAAWVSLFSHRMRCESWWGTVQPTKRTSTYHSNFGPLPANLTSTSLSKANISESQFPKSVGQALALSFSLRELRI